MAMASEFVKCIVIRSGKEKKREVMAILGGYFILERIAKANEICKI